jgi:hypothetical protein
MVEAARWNLRGSLFELVVRGHNELREVDEEGRSVRTIPFTVSVGWLAQMARLNLLVFGDELQITYHFQPGVVREPPIFRCPIIARPAWTLVLMAAIVGLLWALVPKIATDLTFADERLEAVRTFGQSLLRWDFWLWLLGVAAVVWLLVTLANSWSVFRRSRELEAAFEEQFPSHLD